MNLQRLATGRGNRPKAAPIGDALYHLANAERSLALATTRGCQYTREFYRQASDLRRRLTDAMEEAEG